MELPDEIITQIFDIAADEDVIFQYGLPGVMAESAWFKNIMDEWTLRTPQEAINMIQRRSYATKKAIMLTCKSWRRLGSEFLFRCLFFNDPSRLILLCQALEAHAKINESADKPSVGLGWWTKRIHLTRYYASPSRGITIEDMCSALTTIIKHCPNLSIFIVEWPMPSDTFGLVADTLYTYTRKHLRTVHWHVPAETIPKVIWALDSLPLLLAAHIEFEPPTASTELEETLHLGAAQDVHLKLPCLQQLSLRGSFAEFVEQATGWDLSGLRNLSFDCGHSRVDMPDVFSFLKMHGSNLTVLDLNAIPPVEVPEILELCPLLEVFCFNADWRLRSPTVLQADLYAVGDDDDEGASGSSRRRGRRSNTMRVSLGGQHLEMSILTHKPHPRIHTIGLHGLLYAFGVGFAASYASVEPLRSNIICRSNDLNFAALNRTQFPQLRRVRVLSRSVLSDLNRNDGPGRDEDEDADGGLGTRGISGMERWARWMDMCDAMGVGLEDCTGQELGTLPQDDDDEADDDDDEEDGSEDDEDASEEGESNPYEENEWEAQITPTERSGDVPHVNELRMLIAECQAMAVDRDESPFGDFIGPVPQLPPSLAFEAEASAVFASSAHAHASGASDDASSSATLVGEA